MAKPQAANQKIMLYVVAEDRYFISHRLPMAKAAAQAGFNVHVAAPPGSSYQLIIDAGFTLHHLYHFDRTSTQPLKEIRAIGELTRLYHRLRPYAVHHVAMKPVVYGNIAGFINAIFFKNPIKIINALGGLGYLFISSSMKARIIRTGLAIVMNYLSRRKNILYILQNHDDRETLVKHGFIAVDRGIIVPGSGVDAAFYTEIPEPEIGIAGPVIAYIGRMLKDKGLCELSAAIRLIKERNIKAQFVWYGDVDLKNPASLTREQVQQWHDNGLIKWYGSIPHSRDAYQQCHMAILPSYREGLPKSLLEAAACGRPIITTDVPGCRDVVEHNVTGFCVSRIDMVNELVLYLIKLINDADLRQNMGARGRQRVLNQFTDDIITQSMISIYQEL